MRREEEERDKNNEDLQERGRERDNFFLSFTVSITLLVGLVLGKC